MKKTLVALAVLAASGASFAQVAITGNVSMGWAGGQTADGKQSSGLGVDTATIDFAVSEDLGGGLKVTAHEGFDTMARNGVTGGDTGMTLGTSTWSVYLGANQLAPYLAGNASVGGLFNGFDNKIFSAKNSGQDFAGVSFAVTPSITLSVTEYENNAGLGLTSGSGGDATTTGQRNTQYQIAYASGALKADAAYKSYDAATATAATTTYKDIKSITRGSANYDFGVAKVGAGIEARTLVINGTDTMATVSANVPFGALGFGVQWANRTVNGANTLTTVNDYNQSGYGLELDYNFSKSTKLALNYMNWQQISANAGAKALTVGYGDVGGGQNSTLTEIALSKSF